MLDIVMRGTRLTWVTPRSGSFSKMHPNKHNDVVLISNNSKTLSCTGYLRAHQLLDVGDTIITFGWHTSRSRWTSSRLCLATLRSRETLFYNNNILCWDSFVGRSTADLKSFSALCKSRLGELSWLNRTGNLNWVVITNEDLSRFSSGFLEGLLCSFVGFLSHPGFADLHCYPMKFEFQKPVLDHLVALHEYEHCKEFIQYVLECTCMQVCYAKESVERLRHHSNRPLQQPNVSVWDRMHHWVLSHCLRIFINFLIDTFQKALNTYLFEWISKRATYNGCYERTVLFCDAFLFEVATIQWRTRIRESNYPLFNIIFIIN